MHDDVVFEDKFIWHRLKNELNKRKHKIIFENAVSVFNDPLAVNFFDEENTTDREDRFRITGYISVRPSFITVAYTLRMDLIRILSARAADREEKEAYFENAERY